MFQQYVKSLKERGVILAVCSKNEEANAREVFEKHAEMVLRMSDISCFVANWQDKPSNLKSIASTLNIGLNSLVFVDDNPAERSIVRRLVPEVAVPELPIDPAGYVRALDEQRYFQVVSVAPEDFQRTDYYRGDAMRKSVEAAAGDMEEFLSSLEMVARVGPIDATTLERSAQLIQRSNQFNLTTVRRSTAELLPLLSDPAWVTLTVSLADRFGDNGLISVLLAHISGEVVEIDTWLMSCRVLKRGVEHLLLNCACREALARGAKFVRGAYIPTAKNALVKDHFPKLGFQRAGGDDDGRTEWELNLTDGWQPQKTFITEINTDGTVER
jgi:FkbH-like protein